MKITVTVHAHAKKTQVQQTGENTFKVSVSAPPQDGKANYAVIKALAEYFSVTQAKVILLSGEKNKQKIFLIDTDTIIKQ